MACLYEHCYSTTWMRRGHTWATMDRRRTYRKLFRTQIEEHRAKLLERAECLRLRRRDDRMRRSRISMGEQRVRKIREILDMYDRNGFQRPRHQRAFHEAFLRASVLRLYADDVNVDMNRVMRDNGWDDIKQYCVVMTPRRCGKTMSVSMFSAAFGIAVPGTEQSLYSTCSRASKSLLDNVRKFLDLTGMVKIKKCNKEDLFFVLHGSTVETKIHCYPSNPEVLCLLVCLLASLSLSLFYVILHVWLFSPCRQCRQC